MAAPVVHFEVIEEDFDKLRFFYGELFDWELKAPMERYALVDPQEAGIGGGIGAAPDGHGYGATFYVQVPNLEAALERAEAIGGKRLMEPTDVAEGVRIAHIADPEGHRIGLTQG